MQTRNRKPVNNMDKGQFKQYCLAAGIRTTTKKNHLNRTLCREHASAVLGVSERTIDRYLKNGCDNPAVVAHLTSLVFGCNQGGDWKGWRMDSEYLTSPYGWRVNRDYLKRLYFLRNADLYADQRIKHIEQALADLHRVNETGNQKRIINLATELLDAINHKSSIYERYAELSRDNVTDFSSAFRTIKKA